MADLTVFVEGPADKKFIQDFIRVHFQKVLEIDTDIKGFGGKDKWAETEGFFRKSTAAGKANLLIFDSDNDPQNRRQELIKKKKELGIDFELFLFPNNSDPGDLESILEQIAGRPSKAIFDCFENYKSCIDHIDRSYTKPDRKTKIYAYSEILTGSGNEKDRDYTVNEIWDLNHKSLLPLIDFLKPYLS